MADGDAPAEAIGIAVMAKAPLAGYAKTRLIPTLGAAAAARLHRQLTLRTLDTARAAALGPVTLWCAPDAGQRFFRAVARRWALDLRAQPTGDLGQRMAEVFAANAGRPLLLIGSDCPVLGVDHLRQAARALASGHDAVFITAEDGGYVLVGLTQPHPALFAGIAWSSAQVMEQTRDRLAALGLRWRKTAQLWDIDRAADLARWRAQHAAAAGA